MSDYNSSFGNENTNRYQNLAFEPMADYGSGAKPGSDNGFERLIADLKVALARVTAFEGSVIRVQTEGELPFLNGEAYWNYGNLLGSLLRLCLEYNEGQAVNLFISVRAVQVKELLIDFEVSSSGNWISQELTDACLNPEVEITTGNYDAVSLIQSRLVALRMPAIQAGVQLTGTSLEGKAIRFSFTGTFKKLPHATDFYPPELPRFRIDYEKEQNDADSFQEPVVCLPGAAGQPTLPLLNFSGFLNYPEPGKKFLIEMAGLNVAMLQHLRSEYPAALQSGAAEKVNLLFHRIKPALQQLEFTKLQNLLQKGKHLVKSDETGKTGIYLPSVEVKAHLAHFYMVTNQALAELKGYLEQLNTKD